MSGPRGQHAAWETIAASFDRSRRRTWPHVEAFLDGLPAGARVLDLMCGNGRHTAAARSRGLDVVALDWSRPLVRIAHGRYGGGVAGDATRLPFRDASFDACIYVAGLHGIPSAEGRATSLRELHRVLRPEGTAQVTVWSREAPRFRAEGTPGEPVDVVIPWRSDGHDVARTYHLYTRTALVAEVQAAGFDVLDATGVDVLGNGVDNEAVVVRRQP